MMRRTRYQVASQCFRCGYRPADAGKITDSVVYTCPECGYLFTLNSPLEPTPDEQGLVGQVFEFLMRPRNSGTPFIEHPNTVSRVEQYEQRIYHTDLPGSFWGIVAVVLIFLVGGVYFLSERYGLMHVAFVTGAALIVFALTTIALSMILDSKRQRWLARIVAPLAAGMFAVMFWYFLLGNRDVNSLIDQLTGSYLKAIGIVVTIVVVFIGAWLFWKSLRGFSGRE